MNSLDLFEQENIANYKSSKMRPVSDLIANLLINEAVLEESAIPLVTDILKDELGSEAAKCVAVKITEQVSDNQYKALATLDNGNDIKIMIEDCDDMVRVTIPLEQ